MKWTGKWMVGAALGAAALVTSVAAFAQQQMEGVRGADAIEGIFGVDAETLASAISSARESESILSSVAGVVNMAALLAAVCVVLLTFINAILQTGEHGKVGGRYSMVWVPLRVAIAAGFLTPLSLGGYSVVQAMVLWLGMQGSGFADEAWSRSNAALSERMALSATIVPRASADVASKLYEMEACADAVRKSAEGDGSAATASTFGVASPENFVMTEEQRFFSSQRQIQLSLKYSGEGSLGNVDSLCGSVVLERSVPTGTEAAHVVERDVADLALNNQATAVLLVREQVRDLYQQRVEGGLPATAIRSRLIEIEGDYVRRMERLARLVNARKMSAEVEFRQAQMATAEANGWLVAGAYYMTFAAFDATLNAQATLPPTFNGPRTSEMSPSIISDVGPQIAAARQIIPRTEDPAAIYVHPDEPGDNAALGLAALQSLSSPGAGASQMVEILQRKLATIARSGYTWIAEATVDDGTGFVPKVVSWGHLLLSIAAALLAATLVFAGGLTLATGVGGIAALGLGMSIVVPMFLLGAGMAYVLPALPLLIWMAGVAGWLMMLVQAVVAAPLWAAAHAMPEGEGFAGQRAMQGYMLLISLVARPVLMIAGLLAGMLLLDFLGSYVLKAFQVFTGASSGLRTEAPGLVGMLVWIFLTAAMLLVLTRWSFSLIHLVPDSVLRFIGAATESFGETQMAEQARTMAVGAWMATQRAVGGASGGISRSIGGLGGGKAGGVSASKG